MDFGHENGSSKNASAETEPILNTDPCQPSILSGDIENEEQSRTGSHHTTEGVTYEGIEISVSPHSAVSSSSESDCNVDEDEIELIPAVYPNSNNNDSQSSPRSVKSAEFHGREVNDVSNAALLSMEKVYGYSRSVSEVSCSNHPVVYPNSYNNDAQSSPRSVKSAEFHGREVNDVSTAALLSMEKVYGYSRSVSEVSCSNHPSPLPVLSPTQPPPFQTMERPEGYDPCRIPASIFISGTSTPKDWSVNSNDSLFSIGIGRNSAAKEVCAGAESLNSPDHITPEEPQKWKAFHGSGELGRQKELHSSPVVKISNKVTVLGETSPISKQKKLKQKRLDLRKNRTLLKGQPEDTPTNINVEGKSNEEGRQNRYTFQHSVENRTNDKSSGTPINKESSKMPCCECSSNCTCRCLSSRPCSWFCCMFSSNCKSECCSRSPCCWSCKWSCPPSSCCKSPSCSKCSCSPNFCCQFPSCSKCSCSPTFCCKWTNCSKCSCSSTFCCKWPNCSKCSCSPAFCCKWPNCSKCSCSPTFCCKWTNCFKCSCSPTLCCKWTSCCPCSKCSFSPSCCCKWPSCSSRSFKCHFPDCSYRKCIAYCFPCKGAFRLKGCRRMKCCSCPSCFCCCSSCC